MYGNFTEFLRKFTEKIMERKQRKIWVLQILLCKVISYLFSIMAYLFFDMEANNSIYCETLTRVQSG